MNLTAIELAQQIDVLVRARVPLIILQTLEESRGLQAVASAAERSKRSVVVWNSFDGFVPADLVSSERSDPRDPLAALAACGSHQGKSIFVLHDIAEMWSDSRIRRGLKSSSIRARSSQSSIIVLTHLQTVPSDLSELAVVLSLKFPTIDELEVSLSGLENSPKLVNNLSGEGRSRLLEAAVGLTSMQAEATFSRAIVGDGVLDDSDVELVRDAKRQLISASRALEFIDIADKPIETGGLHALKEWLEVRKRGFEPAAKKFGLHPPKGVALIGIPGTGKSLSARYIAQLWGLPLLRLDLGSVFGSFVGESEERIRDALRRAEAVAPCVLWIDELEKGIASGGNDGGTSSRVFGTFLTWMQEKTAPVSVVATANDVSRLPPELLRRGRFDEVFFLDLPNGSERRNILEIQLSNRRRDPSGFDLDALSTLCAGFVGAEIEQVVVDALYAAYSRDEELSTMHIQESISAAVPLSRSQVEIVNSLRSWLLEGRARSASFRDVQEASEQFVALEID